MMKRLSLLLALLALFIQPKFCLADENLILNGEFADDASYWDPGKRCAQAPVSGLYCYAFSNPVETEDGEWAHEVTYTLPISLTKNTVYELSFYARTDCLMQTMRTDSKVVLSPDEKDLILHTSYLSQEWNHIVMRFMADSTDAYTLSFAFHTGDTESVIFMDSICLAPIDFSPAGFGVQGAQSVMIPDYGYNTYWYTPIVIDQNGNAVSILNASIQADDDLPDGIVFDSQNGILKVEASASSPHSLALKCVLDDGGFTLPSTDLWIEISKNIIENGGFDHSPLYTGWDTEASNFQIQYEDEFGYYAQLSTSQLDTDLYYATLSPLHSVVLYSSHLYVFRAKLRTEGGSGRTASQAQVSVLSDAVHIQISAAGNADWENVITAFRVPSDGIYTLTFSFLSDDSRAVCVDSILVQPEDLAPSSLSFYLPAHVSIPKTGFIRLPVPVSVFDQSGLIQDAATNISIMPEDTGVYFENGMLIISSRAEEGVYTFRAYLAEDSSVFLEQKVLITHNSVGDGSFENTSVGQFWATAAPSRLSYVTTFNGTDPRDGTRLARLNMNGDVSVIFSDSVFQYASSKSYVFEADIKAVVPDIPTVVTILADNYLSDEFDDNLVIGQFTLSSEMQHIQKLFTPSEDVTGKLMIAFNTPQEHDQQIILLDNITISDAAVYASGLTISGTPYVDKNIIGKYRFTSNFHAIDASLCRWLISETENGIFMPIENQTGNTLSITSEMENKYIKFEVTPVSLSGPVVGESVTSYTIRIGTPLPSVTISEETAPIYAAPESIPDTTQEKADDENKPTMYKGELTALDISRYTNTTNTNFLDLLDHWAKDSIAVMTAAGIVEGKGNGFFEPEALITRAEFSAVLARSFHLAPIYYTGTFTDVQPYNWYAGVVAVVTKHGIAQGTSETTFSPELPITREEMAAMIMRAYQKAGAELCAADYSYTDIGNVSAWALQDVGASKSIGLMTGMPDGSFQPQKHATRAEAVVTIRRMLQKIAETVSE